MMWGVLCEGEGCGECDVRECDQVACGGGV